MRNGAIGCAVLLAVIEGVGIGIGKYFSGNTRLEVSSCPWETEKSWRWFVLMAFFRLLLLPGPSCKWPDLSAIFPSTGDAPRATIFPSPSKLDAADMIFAFHLPSNFLVCLFSNRIFRHPSLSG